MRFLRWLFGIEHELGRVQWPTREQRPPLREGGGDWLAMAKWLKEQR